MRNIILTVGIPASGKSSWVRDEMRKHPGQYKRVNKDLLRLMIDDDKWSLPNEKFILAIRDRIVERALRHGFDVLLDDCNFPFGGKHFLRMCEIADLVGDVQVTEKYFDIELKEALKRNANVDRTAVPEEIIHRMFEKNIKNKKFETSTYYAPPVQKLEQDASLPHCIIVDVDGTLALNTSGRSAYEWQRVGEDEVNKPVLRLVEFVTHTNTDSCNGVKTIIFSGRDGICEKETRDWLHWNSIPFDALYMRTPNDNRADDIVKRELYEQHIKDKYYVEFVVDDRLKVVELYRRLGLTVLQCAYGDF